MLNFKAFLAALLLFAGTVFGFHLYLQYRNHPDAEAFAFWSSEEKSGNRTALAEEISQVDFPVFGSSEFQHGTDTEFYPSAVFSGTGFCPMLIGAGYYQSLSHAITLAALAPQMRVKKAVLIVSPQWFRKTGVVDQAFSSRFSETLYTAMLQNEDLSDDTKQYIQDRTHTLLQADEKTLERILSQEKLLSGENQNLFDRGIYSLWKTFLQEKEAFSAAWLEFRDQIPCAKQTGNISAEPDFEELLSRAQADGAISNQNAFYMKQEQYEKLEPYLSEKKDMNRDAVKGYQNSPEYQDLAIFLQVCQELDIEPMIIYLPVNGYYYDYTGFPKSAREAYYEKAKAVAEEYGAEIADFTDQEYTQYFFEDRVHLGQVGWTLVNKSLWEFYQS